MDCGWGNVSFFIETIINYFLSDLSALLVLYANIFWNDAVVDVVNADVVILRSTRLLYHFLNFNCYFAFIWYVFFLF